MAQAILLQDVENVGSRGEVIDVSPGYLRNYLLPRKLAHQATPGALAEAQRRMEAAEQAARDAADRAQENAALLSRTVLTIPQPAGEDGRLFGSVTSEDIVNAIKQARGLKIDRRKVHLEQPIRTTGTHMVTVEVHDGVTADVKTIVTPEG
jgi:large subunit ribosomal protein L9